MFELNQLEQLVAVVEEGTISKAAEKLLISQPALSRSIQKLEIQLNIKLFRRTKNKIDLNENGKLAYTRAKKILALAYEMKDDLIAFDRANYKTNLASCAPAPIWAMEYVFNGNLNSIMIDNSKDMIEGLLTNKYSLIILNHYVENREFICTRMLTEKLYLSVVADHHLATKDTISFKELNGESIILSSKIGFWSRLCQENLPDSHLLYQKDEALHELVRYSTLPSFKTDISIKRVRDDNKRIYIPIIDSEATANYYLCFMKKNLEKYQCIKNKIKTIDWKSSKKHEYKG